MASPDPEPDARQPGSSGDRRGTPARPLGTFRIGTIAGSDVLVSSSWFVVAGLIAVLMAPRIEEAEPGLGAWKYVAGVAFAVVLYLSVLLHEASHAFMARRYGFPVTSITLHFLGGMTAIEGEAQKPRQEFMIAVVGPVTSIAVGAAAGGLWLVMPDGLLRMAVGALAGGNLLVGLLNLVPGLPLDGGRILKSAVWGATGNVHRGTIVAGWGGRLTAVAVMGWPLLQEPLVGESPEIIDFVLSFIIGPVPLDRLDVGHVVGQAPSAPAEPGGPRPRPSDAHRAGRPAPGRGRASRAGGRGRQHRHRDREWSTHRGGERGSTAGHAGGSPPLGLRLDGCPHPRLEGSASP